MSDFEKTFTKQEYQSRVQKVKQKMQEKGFDLIICQDPANICYLTGFDGWSFYTPQVILVHLNEEFPIWFGRAQDAQCAHITTDLPAENIMPYSEHLVQHQTLHPYDELVDLIKATKWDTAHIGVGLDSHYYTARAHQHLVKGLPNARISDNHELINWQRLIKSDAELEIMRQAGKICAKTMESAIAKMRPGVPQNHVIADIYYNQVMGIEGFGGDYSAIAPLMPVGSGTATPHLTWSDDPLPETGLIMLEIAGVRKRYHTPLTRSIHLGQPAQKIKDTAKYVVEAISAGMEMAKPGNLAQDINAAYQAVLQKNNLVKDSRMGYPIGLNYPPDWGERTCSLREGDETELKAGMCFHAHAGVYVDDWGVAISESFVVGGAGGERLCDFSRELIIVE
ncbi:MAG: M24 family metallopeptidase [Hyphomicrobiales bacterium]